MGLALGVAVVTEVGDVMAGASPETVGAKVVMLEERIFAERENPEEVIAGEAQEVNLKGHEIDARRVEGQALRGGASRDARIWN